MARCEFGQNEVPIVWGHGRTASDGRYRTLEFEGETDHRLVRSLAVRRSRSGSIGDDREPAKLSRASFSGLQFYPSPHPKEA